MTYNKKINDFINIINKNAPLTKVYKYPYKPALIIAILNNVDNNKILFNHWINLKDDKILRTYYDLLTSDVNLFDALKNQKSKSFINIELGFNEKVKEKIIQNIFEMPVKKLYRKNGIWQFNKNKYEIKIEIELNIIDEITKLKKYLLDSAINIFKKCVPSYKDIHNSSIESFDELINQEIIYKNNDKFTKTKIRQYQHIFSKLVKDRDKKCLICCESEPTLLEACHIKPYSDCETILEKYDENNGITLCANHHKLFDNYKFSFNNDWTIKISKSFENSDYYLKFKEFEKCFELLKYKKISNINKFLEYRNNKHPIN